jgi:type IV secretory pathway VirB4 component
MLFLATRKNVIPKKPFRISIHKKYYSSDKYSAKFYLADSRYNLGNEFSRFVDAYGRDLSIFMTLKPIGGNTAKKRLKNMRSERSSELKVKNSKDARSEMIRSQIREIDDLIARMQREKSSLIDLTMDVKISSDHPVSLGSEVSRFIMSMELLSLFFARSEFFTRRSVKKRLLSDSLRHRYLADSSSIAAFLPIFLSTSVLHDGVMIGTDSTTGVPVFLDQFRLPSHNLLIMGETGSGKSFFAKLLIQRFRVTNRVHRVIVLDPLDEYLPSMLGNNSVVIDTSAGEYIDFSLYLSEENRILEKVNFLTDTASLNESEQQELNAIASSNSSNMDLGELARYVSATAKSLHLREKMLFLGGKMLKKRKEIDYVKSNILIKTPSEPGNERERILTFTLTMARYLARTDDSRKIVLIDEMHLFLSGENSASHLSNLFRNSRHFNTSIIGLTQNSYDLDQTAYANSVRDNSIASFVFRTRSLKEDGKTARYINLEGHDPELLAGGRNSDYSECIMVFNRRIKKLRINATGREMEIIGNFSAQPSSR